MIIPIRCMSCGNILADKWNFYKEELQKKKGDSYNQNRYFMDGTEMNKETLEFTIMKKMGIKRPCCRKHFLTHVDLIEKI